MILGCISIAKYVYLDIYIYIYIYNEFNVCCSYVYFDSFRILCNCFLT
ncbi:MAG: hypothetical protein N7Q72_02760 [Spiroplasma sp. Tabriz.8]|nr:hypothetical protein [Spiroplasma sp. Tabriz.8]